MTKSRGIYERHGKHGAPAYGVWNSMKSRCENPKVKTYPDYGGRGITVCERWKKFSNFLADMGEPAPGMTLERIENNKGYYKENCVWASRTEQGRNKRNNIFLTINGETLPLSAWAERSGIKYTTIHQRMANGWTPEAAVKTPLVTVRKGIPRGVKIHQFEVIA